METGILRPAIEASLVQEHLDRAVDLLEENGADSLFIFRESNILAFCGVPLAPSDRLICGLLNSDGRLAFVVPNFEADIARALPATARLFAWEESDDPFDAVAAAATHLGVDRGRIFLDRFTWLGVSENLASALPDARLELDPGIFEQVRLIKTAEEVETVRQACCDAGVLYEVLPTLLRPERCETEISVEALSLVERRGVHPYGFLLQSGSTASVPHQEAGSRMLTPGDMIIADFVAVRRGYHGDMTRTFALGRPSEEAKVAYTAVRDAQRAAIDAIRPGVTCEAVDDVARSRLDAVGLGRFFSHRLGHGIGLDCHEPPFLVQGNAQVLQPGMCVTIEPGVYVPGTFGVRIEDVVAVTEDGCEVLSNGVPTDMSDVFA